MPPVNYPQDLRQDPFTLADESVALTGELQTVPSAFPYYVYLNEIPRQDTTSSLYVASLGSPTNIYPDEQTYVNQGDPTAIMYSYNSGTEAVLQAGRDSAGNGSYNYRTLLNVDISSTVGTAVLFLYRSSGEAAPELAIYELTSAWDETTATWNNQPTFNSVAIAEMQMIASDDGWYSVDLTSWWNTAFASGTNYGLMITSDEVTTGVTQVFSSARGPYPPYFAIQAANQYTEVAVEPTSGQVQCDYQLGVLRFYSDAAGASLTCSYIGTGSLARAENVWATNLPTAANSPGRPGQFAIVSATVGATTSQYLAICVAQNTWNFTSALSATFP